MVRRGSPPERANDRISSFRIPQTIGAAEHLPLGQAAISSERNSSEPTVSEDRVPRARPGRAASPAPGRGLVPGSRYCSTNAASVSIYALRSTQTDRETVV